MVFITQVAIQAATAWFASSTPCPGSRGVESGSAFIDFDRKLPPPLRISRALGSQANAQALEIFIQKLTRRVLRLSSSVCPIAGSNTAAGMQT